MSNFEKLVQKYYDLVLEAEGDAPAGDAPADAGGGAPPPPPDAGGAPAGGGAGGEMDNESKRDTDPREYTRSVLALLVDKKEGVSPEMFDDFLDSVSLAITKIKDKEGIKKFYKSFHQKLESVLELREELKDMFKQLSGTLDDLVGAQEEPDQAGGGAGKAGPSGPGVK